MLRHFVPSRWLHPLAPLKRLSPVDLPSANGFDKPFAASKFENSKRNLTKERERMKKIMFGNSLMLLGIAIMILAGLKVIYVGTLWVSFLLIIVGFVMATIGFFGKDSK